MTKQTVIPLPFLSIRIAANPEPDEEMPDADEEPEREITPVEAPPPIKPAELKEEVTVNGGRRRGKRQVMKKTTVKDEEGFLGPCSPFGNSRHVLIQCSNSGRADVGVFLRR